MYINLKLMIILNALKNISRVCKLFSRELRKERYMYTCKECPDVYPWIKNEFGMDF